MSTTLSSVRNHYIEQTERPIIALPLVFLILLLLEKKHTKNHGKKLTV